METGVAGANTVRRIIGQILVLVWEDKADTGFWGWRRHGDLVIMSAELELAAWAVSGEKRWTTFVEPPWSYDVRDGQIELDVMGKKSTFPVEAGPDAGAG